MIEFDTQIIPTARAMSFLSLLDAFSFQSAQRIIRYLSICRAYTNNSDAIANNFPGIVKGAYWGVLNADLSQQEVKPANYLHRIERANAPFKLEDDAESLYHHPSIWSAIYKKDFLYSNAKRMPEIPGAGWVDSPWMVETILKAKSNVYVDECLFFYREIIPGSSPLVKNPPLSTTDGLIWGKIVKDDFLVSARMLEGHYNRGYAYPKELSGCLNPNDSKIISAKKRMVGPYNSEAVTRSSNIRPEYKKLSSAQNPLAWTQYRERRKISHILMKSCHKSMF